MKDNNPRRNHRAVWASYKNGHRCVMETHNKSDDEYPVKLVYGLCTAWSISVCFSVFLT